MANKVRRAIKIDARVSPFYMIGFYISIDNVTHNLDDAISNKV